LNSYGILDSWIICFSQAAPTQSSHRAFPSR
jgi:hypothetical protein